MLYTESYKGFSVKPFLEFFRLTKKMFSWETLKSLVGKPLQDLVIIIAFLLRL